MNTWIYWETGSQFCGETPGLIKLCRQTVMNYCDNVHLVNLGNVDKYCPNINSRVWEWSNIPMRADVIRAHLLRDHGGLWLDSDLIVLQSLKELFKDYEFVGYKKTSHGDNHIPNNVMYAPKGSPAMQRYVELQNKMMYNNSKLAWNALGGKLLTKAVDEDKSYFVDEKRIQPIPWQEQDKFYSNDEPEIDEDTLTFMFFNNGLATRKEIPDLRWKTAEEILDMDILLTRILKNHL